MLDEFLISPSYVGHPSKESRIRDMLDAAAGWMPISSPIGNGAVEEEPDEGHLQDTPAKPTSITTSTQFGASSDAHLVVERQNLTTVYSVEHEFEDGEVLESEYMALEKVAQCDIQLTFATPAQDPNTNQPPIIATPSLATTSNHLTAGLVSLGKTVATSSASTDSEPLLVPSTPTNLLLTPVKSIFITSEIPGENVFMGRDVDKDPNATGQSQHQTTNSQNQTQPVDPASSTQLNMGTTTTQAPETTTSEQNTLNHQEQQIPTMLGTEPIVDDLALFLDFVSGTPSAPLLHTPPRVNPIPTSNDSASTTNGIVSQQRKSTRLADKAKTNPTKGTIQLAQQVLMNKLGELVPDLHQKNITTFESMAQHLPRPFTKNMMETLKTLVEEGNKSRKKKKSKILPTSAGK
jgi:hypothetical protein